MSHQSALYGLDQNDPGKITHHMLPREYTVKYGLNPLDFPRAQAIFYGISRLAF